MFGFLFIFLKLAYSSVVTYGLSQVL